MLRFTTTLFWLFILTGSAIGADFTLTWDAPTANTDGTPLTDLAGYKVYYGTETKTYGPPVDVKKVLTYTITGLKTDQTYYFAVTAYDTSNNESAYSNEINIMSPSIPGQPTLKVVICITFKGE